MFIRAYGAALKVLAKKPFVLWGLSLMSVLISVLGTIFFGILPAIGMAISYLIAVGMSKVYLDGLAGEQVYSDQLFAGFNKNCFRIAGGMAWTDLWILIWMLIPFAGPVFAVIKSYQYRFVPYILITHPEVKATEALRISKQMTSGIRGQMFLADLCWIAALFVTCFVLSIFAQIPFLGIIFSFTLVVLVIVVAIFSNIFTGLYQAYFYEEKSKALYEAYKAE